MILKKHFLTLKQTAIIVSIVGVFLLTLIYEFQSIREEYGRKGQLNLIENQVKLKKRAILALYQAGGIESVIRYIESYEKSIGDSYLYYFLNSQSLKPLNRNSAEELYIEQLQMIKQGIQLNTTVHEVLNRVLYTVTPIDENIVLFESIPFDRVGSVDSSTMEREALYILTTLFFLLILFFGYLTCRIFKSKIKTIISDVNRIAPDTELRIRCVSQDDDMENLVLAIQTMVNRILENGKELKTQNLKLQDTVALLDEYKRAVDESNIVSKSDLSGRITYVNDNFCETSGYTRKEALGKPHSIVRSESTPSAIFEDLWTTIQSQRTWKGILKNRRKDGSYYYVDITILPILNRYGQIDEFMAIRHDITELIEKRQELESIAQTDTLTGLGNRFKLLKDLEFVEKPAIAIIDIDRFNEINDFYGYQFGDRIIQQFGKIIEANIPPYYRLYHLHGDDFAVLVDGIEESNFIYVIENLSQKLATHIFTIDGRDIVIQATSAISFESRNEIIQTADMTKKLAKRQKKHISIYSKSLQLDKEYKKNIEWTDKIKKALSDGRIVPYYQPIYNNHTSRIEKYEALVRMIDTDGKVISPYFFLDVAKKSKQYIAITKRVIAVSFETFSGIDKEFSINLTIEDILSDELQSYLHKMLDKYSIAKQVVLEIVESEGIENYGKVTEFISDMRERGCKIAIDDFGTGYSNFDYLLKLSPDYLKIDGSMIKNIDTDSNSEDIVMAIIQFAKARGFLTIAEFVSSEEILKKVKELGIDYSQGYLISPPVERV